MSIEDIRRKAGKFQRKVFWRNGREYVASLVVAAFFGFELWRTNDALTRSGFALMIAGLGYLVWHLHRKGSSRDLPAELGLKSGLEFFKGQLEIQRELLQSVWRWYLGPLVPGLVVLTLAMARTNPHHVPHYNWFLAGYSLVVAFTFVVIWKLNAHAAKRFQRRIDELNALQDAR